MAAQPEQRHAGLAPGVILVLAHASDSGAASVAASVHNLLSGTPTEVWTVRPESLGQAAWSHTVDAHGYAHTRLVLPGRAALHSTQIRAVFNRIRHLPVPRLSDPQPADRDYAAQELQALVLSWLAACGDCVVQPLRSQPWLVPQLPLLHWASAAARCGLPVAVRDARSVAEPWDATVLVAGMLTTGVLAVRLGVACVATAQNLGFTLLEFRFNRQGEAATLVDVTPHPALSDLEDIDAVARCLADLAHRTLVDEAA
ncbi:MAG: hypothetical protein H7172_11780 [Ferruginibacter sp.]|nr:hypothetical protein [Rhodoferax sp.]